MDKRGFKCDPNRKFPKQIFIENDLYNDWIPSIEDYKVIRKRIELKISEKPEWYRKTEYR